MTKAEAYALWRRTVWRDRRGRYWTEEHGVAVRAVSWAAFWRTVQRSNRLYASDKTGGRDLTL